MGPRVFVVDDDPGVREGLRILLASAGHDVETFPDAPSFLAAYDGSRPGCAVLDIRMPGPSGLDLQDQLRARGLDIPVIMLTGHGTVPASVRAMKTGAVDFLEKPCDDRRLLEAIERGLRRDAELRQARTRRDELKARLARLTPRERQVFEALVAGRATKQIATQLGVSTQAVDAHRQHIRHKLQAETLAELVRVGVLLGLGI